MTHSDTAGLLQNLAVNYDHFDINASPVIDKSNMNSMMIASQNNFNQMVANLGLNGLDGHGGFDYGINDQLVEAPKAKLLLLL
jgi:hypothetical protein